MIETIWELPEEGLELGHIEHVVRKALAEVEGAAMEPVGPDGSARMSFHLGMPEWMVRDAGDRPQRPPDEHGRYWCVVRLEAGASGRPAVLALAPREADLDEIPHGAAEIAERIAGLLQARPIHV